MDIANAVATPKQRNRWKIAFFVLLAFFALFIEMARETTLLVDAKAPTGPPLTVRGDADFAQAYGSWVRSDGGSRLMPNTVQIQCDAATRICTEAQASIVGSTGFQYLDVLSATYPVTEWTAGSITYAKQDAGCVAYQTRLDLAQERATATRKLREEIPAGLTCDNLEPEVRMELTSGIAAQQAAPKPKTPVFDLIASLL